MSERRRAVVQWAVVGVPGLPGRSGRAGCSHGRVQRAAAYWAGLGHVNPTRHGCRTSTAHDSRTQSDG
eukprot:4949578-Prymnesium_polylepis.1